MHELSLAGSILQLVQDAAVRERFARVRRMTLAAGALSGVEVGALRFALDAVAPGTCLEGAEIVIDEPPGRAWCPHCARSLTIGARTDACPCCGGYALQATGGDELKVVDLMVVDDG